jgi:hypothetical protein
MSDTKAYRKFAEMMLHKESQVIPKILQCMITDEQAEMLVSLPGTAAQMAEKSGRNVDAVRNDLNDMFRKGLAFKKEKDGEVLWRAPAHIAQFHDASILRSNNIIPIGARLITCAKGEKNNVRS